MKGRGRESWEGRKHQQEENSEGGRKRIGNRKIEGTLKAGIGVASPGELPKGVQENIDVVLSQEICVTNTWSEKRKDSDTFPRGSSEKDKRQRGREREKDWEEKHEAHSCILQAEGR